MRGRAKVFAVNLLLLVLGMALVEVGARIFGLTPQSVDPMISQGFGRGSYPRSYFVEHPTRGFDIGPSVPPTPFGFADATVEVFSNRYGCFDDHDRFEGPYVLLLGDSFAWGYAPYDRKWGTLLEKRIGVPVAKCGVTHTGQKYQLEKGRSVVDAIGRAPRLVVVSRYDNDPEDDLLFPRATVVGGYLADQAAIEKGAIRRYARAEIEARYERWKRGDGDVKNAGEDLSTRSKIVRRLRETSVVVDAIYLGTGHFGGSFRNHAEGEALARLRQRGVEENHEAIAAIKRWTDAMGAQLLVVIVPGRDSKGSDAPDLKRFLTERGIAFTDLAPAFDAAPDRAALFWKHDPHWSVEGNRIAGEEVAADVRRRFGDFLPH